MAKITIQTAFAVNNEQKRKYEVSLETESIAKLAREHGIPAADKAIDQFLGKYTDNLKQILAETINASAT